MLLLFLFFSTAVCTHMLKSCLGMFLLQTLGVSLLARGVVSRSYFVVRIFHSLIFVVLLLRTYFTTILMLVVILSCVILCTVHCI